MIVNELINLITFKVDKQTIKEAETQLTGVLNKVESFGRKAFVGLTLPLGAIGALFAKSASDAEETENRFNQVFQGLAKEASDWAESLADDLNRSSVAFRDSLATFQTFNVGLGFTRERALNLSKTMEELRLDFSSFFNIRPEDAQRRFISAFSGSSEVMDQFGINLKVAALEQQALRQGITKSVSEMSEMEKVLLRLEIIRTAMGQQGALGDAARTSQEFANRVRSAKDQVKDLAIGFGKILLPVLSKVLEVFIKITKHINLNMSPTMKAIILTMMGFLFVIGPVILALTGLIKIMMAVQGAFIALNTLAAAQNLTLVALAGKYLLMAGAIAAVIAFLALLIEDIIIFQRGGESLIGKVVEAFERLNEKAKEASIFTLEAFRNLIISMNNLFDRFAETLAGLFTGKFKFAFESFIQLVLEGFNFMARIAIASFQPIADIINKLFGKNIDLSKSFEDVKLNIKGVISEVPEFFKNFQLPDFAPGAFTPAPIGVAGGGAAVQKSLNINFQSTIEVPSGTPEEQQRALQQSARRIFRDEMERTTRELLRANPLVE